MRQPRRPQLTLTPQGANHVRVSADSPTRAVVEAVPAGSRQGRVLRQLRQAEDLGWMHTDLVVSLALSVLDAVRALRHANEAAADAAADGSAADPKVANRLARSTGQAMGDLDDAVDRAVEAVADARRMRSRTYPKPREVREEREAATARKLRDRYGP